MPTNAGFQLLQWKRGILNKTMASQAKHVMIIAGEPSGDLHGANLIKAMNKTGLRLRYSGIGGNMMQALDIKLFFHIEKLSVMGISEVVSQFRNIKAAFNTFRRSVHRDPPDLLIFIDFPGFNLKAACFAKKRTIPVLYYITPKVWAWNRSRLKKIRKSIDHAALILPFEEKIFKKENIPATFVGHPLLDVYTPDILPAIKKKTLEKKPEHESLASSIIIGLLPGSRKSEISNLLDTLLQSAKIIHEKCHDVTFLVSGASSLAEGDIASVINKYSRKYNLSGVFTLLPGSPVKIFKRADLIIAASGTVTLEAALWGVPMIIVYKMSPISFLLAKTFVKLQHAGLPNLIAGYEIVPELLQDKANPETIAQKALDLIYSKDVYIMTNKLIMIRTLLGGPGASQRTASIAISMLQRSI